MAVKKYTSLAHHYPKDKWIINGMLILSILFFIIGITAPFLTVTKFFIFDDKITILSGLGALWQESEYLLFLLIGCFTIIFPLLKFTILTLVWNGDESRKEKHEKHVRLITTYGKWSMLDVFVVAVIIVSVKLGNFISEEIHYGFYSFTVSVILSMIASAKIMHLIEQG